VYLCIGRRHHSPPYSIFYAFPWGLHPNVTFPWDSHVGVPKLGFLLSQPYFEASVRMRFTLPKVGTWSPLGLLKLQNSIAGVKTPCLEVFFIPLERSSSLDIENGLA